MFRLVPVLLLGLLLFPATSPAAQAIDGRPASVTGGDRLLLLTEDGRRLTLRLAGIEESPGDGGAARRQLQMLVLGKPVRVEVSSRVRGGGLVGRVLLGGMDVGLRLLATGLVRHRPGELEPALEAGYREAEAAARRRHLGIWSTSRR